MPLADEESRDLDEAFERILRGDDDHRPAISQRLMDKMQDQAITNDALRGPAGVTLDRIMAMPQDEFEAEFADVLNRNAYDEEDAEEAAMGPWTPPPPERVARRTREFYEDKVRRDDEAWERRRAERKAEA